MNNQDPRCLNSTDIGCIEQLTLCIEGLADCLKTTDANQETVDRFRQIGKSAVEEIERAFSDKQAEIDEIREQVATQAKSNAEDRKKIRNSKITSQRILSMMPKRGRDSPK
jgi:hypothetical protein